MLVSTYVASRSVQSVYELGRRADSRDDSAEIPLHTFLREVIVSSSGKGEDVYHLTLSIQLSSAGNGVDHRPRCPDGGFEEVVVARDIPEPSQASRLFACRSERGLQKRFFTYFSPILVWR